MKYEKPEITVLASAVTVVQGSQKGVNPGDGNLPTIAAYEADE
jgi:hypothetical protein